MEVGSRGFKRARERVVHTYETIQESRPHPTVFPEKLPEMCVKLHGFNSETAVLDPFMGIGTTALASVKLGAKFIGFEIDKT